MPFPTASLSPCVLHPQTLLFLSVSLIYTSLLEVPSKKISSDSTYILIRITKRTVQPAVKDKSGLAGLYDRMQHQSKPASAPLAQEEETVSRAQITWAFHGLLFIINAHAVMRL